ncbi:MAG TPA: hypothetical protein VFS11_09130 [Gemmatimonadales bacterium]|nr:hypothetical protein [Gemmatimonadales bacterium]
MLPLASLLLALTVAPLAAQTPWALTQPREAKRTGTFANRLLTESSGVTTSRRYPGVLWSHNDSRNAALIFATDTTGYDLGTFRVEGAKNTDWEDIALGPCGRAAGATAACLYIADTGDNRERRKSATIWRVPEPNPSSAGPDRVASTAPAERLEFRYPDGPHDTEAMWVEPSGDVHLVTKGRSRGVLHFRLRAALWGRADVATAEALGPLPIEADARQDQLVTSAALSPDGRRVVVRTYTEAYFFDHAPDGSLAQPARPLACNLSGLEIQGEGIAWLDRERLVLTSERALLRRGTITVVRCELPPLTS